MRVLRAFLFVAALAIVTGCRGIYPPENVEPIERVLVATGYCPCGQCCGWRRTWYGRPVYASGPNKGKVKKVGITASGRHARKGTIAGDASMYPFGTIMYVEGYGYGRVEDRGGDIKGNRIDLFFPTHRQAMEWGRQTVRVKIWLPPVASAD